MIRFIFALLSNLVALLFLPLTWLFRALPFSRPAGRSGWLTMTLDGPSVELAPVRRFKPFRHPFVRHDPAALHPARQALALAAADPKVRGCLVALRRFSCGGAT